MLEIDLMQYTNEANTLAKTHTAPYAAQGTLVENTNLHDPEIDITIVKAPLPYTYAYIPATSAYYYVDRPTYLARGYTDSFGQVHNTYRYKLHLDVLATYADKIRAASGAIVRMRQGSDQIPDRRAVLAQRRETCVKTYPGQWAGQSLVLLVAGPPSLPDEAAAAGPEPESEQRSDNNA